MPYSMQLTALHDHKKHLLLQCISGSRAYGLHTATSDTDIRGVYVLPFANYYGLQYTDQVANQSNDIVYYELKRFVELLTKNNPNLLELLHTPEDCVLVKHPLMATLSSKLFLSRLCKDTFAGYAMSQIKKAKGLNKKVLNPMSEKRKIVSDFCFVTHGIGTMLLSDWLERHGYIADRCGLVALPHFKDVYALFHEDQADGLQLLGIHSGEGADDVRVSAVPKGIAPLAYLAFHKDSYSMYCKDYRAYWDWVAVRNDARYQSTLEHGKNYDAKNMMHTFRLLGMAEDIAYQGKIVVRRPDRAFLLQIRRGTFSYEELMDMAKDKLARIEELFDKSDLPSVPDLHKAEEWLVKTREQYYALRADHG